MALDLTDENTTAYVDLPSGKVKYNVAGSGHPVILLHGSGPGASGWSNFGPNIAALAESFTCYAPDMPGWGDSDPVKPQERDHVQTALELMDALGLEKAAFVGNSMGGATSLKVAARHPDRVSHVISMGAGAPGPRIFSPGNGPSEGLKVLHRGYLDPSPETMRALVDIMTFDKEFATEELVLQRSENARARQDHLDNFAAGLGRPRRGEASMDEIASIKAPTLVIHGRDDRVVHFEAGLRLVSMISDSRLLLLNRCGHWAQLEHADEFNRVVRDFVLNTVPNA